MKPAAALLFLVLAGCASRTPESFRITLPDAGPAILPPHAHEAVPFTELLGRQYNLDFHQGFVDLSKGMAVRVQTARGRETDDVRYRVAGAPSGMRLEAPGKPSLASARRLRFYFAHKLVRDPGQPYHPAFVVWGRNVEELANRGSSAQHDPAAVCQSPRAACFAFDERASVSPEILITVQQEPRYILLTSTVADLLHAEKIQTAPDSLLIVRSRKNASAPVVWDKPADAMKLPLTAGDRISW
jgi:hypothetical protein